MNPTHPLLTPRHRLQLERWLQAHAPERFWRAPAVQLDRDGRSLCVGFGRPKPEALCQALLRCVLEREATRDAVKERARFGWAHEPAGFVGWCPLPDAADPADQLALAMQAVLEAWSALLTLALSRCRPGPGFGASP